RIHLNWRNIDMAQYSSWMHDVAAQQEADVKQNESVAASSILSLILQSRRHPILAFYIAQKEGKSGGAQRFYFAIPTPNIVLGARANILRVFLMYDFDPGASIDKVLVFDGPNQLIETGVSRVADGSGFDGVDDRIEYGYSSAEQRPSGNDDRHSAGLASP